MFFSPCVERPGWSVVIQKDTRSRRVTCDAIDPLICVEESDGERTFVEDMEARRRRPELHVPNPSLETNARIVDALPRFIPAPLNNHRTPV